MTHQDADLSQQFEDIDSSKLLQDITISLDTEIDINFNFSNFDSCAGRSYVTHSKHINMATIQTNDRYEDKVFLTK